MAVILVAEVGGLRAVKVVFMLEDKRLIWKLKAGDAGALRQIYQNYKDGLLTIAILLLGERAAAEDILYDVFVSFAGQTGRFRLYGSLKNYFVSCVVERVRQKFRSKMYEVVGLESTGPIVAETERPDEPIVGAEQSQMLTEALGRLGRQQREVIVLHLQGGMKFSQIADMQGVSISTVQSRYRYGLDKLQSTLNGKVIQ